MRLLHKLRAWCSEPYRIRLGYGLNAIRNKREARALYNFCRNELCEWSEERRRLNPERAEIYEHYIKLYLWTFRGQGDDEYFIKSVDRFGICAINVYSFATVKAGWFWS